ncbi:glycosyltransferase family 2 protein [Kitasatospora azatica]|uniref:glycosyltransferase family 2 protein n=1 Tax=Kitasatospora azatica TaxID=58347 RepID=UPI000A838DDA|nr:glycosyltransferase family 2 protein [Kitasatospora azatica]
MNHSAGTVVSFAMALSLIMGSAFVAYLAALVTPFLRSRPQPPGDASGFDWHIFVPCRDEEAVIGTTLARLRAEFPGMHLWVIDDGSIDFTGDVIRSYQADDPHVHLVRRVAPNARTGKGDALNAAYQALCEWLPAPLAPERVVIGVFDADGSPASGCLEVISGAQLFGDPEVAAVQIEVRMSNREERQPLGDGPRLRNLLGRTLVRMQDLEFRTAIPAMQLSRRTTRTVAMGGNGQFARLSALRTIAEGAPGPWRGSLLEDYELGLHLKLAGWHTAFTRDTWVDQEGLWNVKQLVAQRTRWSQGAMQCVRYLPQIWNSPKLTTLGVLEVSYCLFQPWLQLFGSVVYPTLVLLLALRYAIHPEIAGQFLSNGGWGLLVAYLGFGLVQFTLWGPLYWRKCERAAGFWRCLGWGMAYSLYIWLYCVCTWRALARLAKGRNSWVKTRRNAELRPVGS